MRASTAVIADIVAGAAFLWERRRGRPSSSETEEAGTADSLMSDWCRFAAQNDPQKFARRLEWDGLDVVAARQMLVGAQQSDGDSVPDWATHIHTILQHFPSTPPPVWKSKVRSDGLLEKVEPYPFEHVLRPFADYAAARLTETCPQVDMLLTAGARRDLEDGLLSRLSEVSAQVLQVEFLSYCSLSSDPEKYKAFVQGLFSGELVGVLQQYPVLARFLGELVRLWIASTSVFVRHLAADLGELAATFNEGEPLGRVSEIQRNLSDPHNGGRTVLKLHFGADPRCFYKPKNLASDVVFQDFLSLLEHEGVLPLKKMQVIVKEDHGWSGEVATLPLHDSHEAKRYFERMGTLLFALYLLGGNDCNIENIIPSGEFPVLIDTETLFQSEPMPAEAPLWGASQIAERQMFSNSVLRVGMLPRWKAGPDGRKHDISSLGGYNGRKDSGVKRVWHNINTDIMRFTFEPVSIESPLARIDGWTIDPLDYRQSFIDGFSKAYEAAIKLRDEERATPASILGRTDLELRFLARNTFVYYGLIDKMLTARSLRSGLRCSFELEALRRNFLHGETRPKAWTMTHFEEQCMSQLDVPRLAMNSASTSLFLGEQQLLEDYFIRSDAEVFAERWKGLSDVDRLVQIAYIKATMPLADSSEVSSKRKANTATGVALQGDEAVDLACKIGRRVSDAAVRGGDGTVSWVTFAYSPESQITQFQPMGLRFYDGVAGTGLFLAALAKASGQQEFRDLAYAALHVTVVNLATILSRSLVQDGMGAGLGLASVAYAQLTASKLLDEPVLLQDALDLAHQITDVFVDADKKLDLLGGAAGGILVLTKIFEATGDDSVRKVILHAGEKLLAARQQTAAHIPAWPTLLGKFLGGYSHGASGIAHAMSKIYKLSGDARFQAAALEGVTYENTLFSEEKGNWRNLLEPADGPFAYWNAWCHGAPGIGLGRMQMLNAIDTPEIRQDIAAALKSAAGQAVLTNVDHVCCGNFGRIEPLIEYARVSGEGSYLQQARLIAGEVVSRVHERGHYSVGQDSAICIPSFHQGLAGIGYQLLRLADSSYYPSVLSWQ